MRKYKSDYTATMASDSLPVAALDQIALYFQALSEPTRLHLLRLLRDNAEHSVGELAELIGTSPANASRHLSMLCQHGFVARESRGNAAYYRVADESVYEMCDVVCAHIVRRLDALQRPYTPAARRRG